MRGVPVVRARKLTDRVQAVMVGKCFWLMPVTRLRPRTRA